MNLDEARHNMVERQIRTWEVLDQRVLDLLETVPREDFVPARYRQQAFADLMIPLPHGEVMMRPNVEGRLLQAVQVQPDETVLEIGTGSGYLTACLATLAGRVETVDIHADLVERARDRLAGQSVDGAPLGNRVRADVGDVCTDWQPQSAHDVLVVTGAVPELPGRFLEWVNPGGRIFVISGPPPIREAQLVTRYDESEWRAESLFETELPLLVNSEKPRPFVF